MQNNKVLDIKLYRYDDILFGKVLFCDKTLGLRDSDENIKFVENQGFGLIGGVLWIPINEYIHNTTFTEKYDDMTVAVSTANKLRGSIGKLNNNYYIEFEDTKIDEIM